LADLRLKTYEKQLEISAERDRLVEEARAKLSINYTAKVDFVVEFMVK